VLFVGPLAVRLLAAAGSRAPVALRLAVRDLARYQARSGAALAAISLGLGIPAAIVVGAAAAEHSPDEGNLADDQLMVRIDEDPSPDRDPEEVRELDTEVGRIAGSLDDPTILALDVAIDPTYDPQGGPPSVRLATPVNENTNRDVATPYVATSELLAHYGIDPQEIGPDIDLLTVETRELKFVDTGWYHSLDEPETVTKVQRIDAPAHSEAPTSLLTPAALTRRGWEAARAGWFVDTGAPLTDEQLSQARERAADAGLAVEARDTQDGLALQRTGATAAGALLALGIVAMAVGLIRSETAGDLRTLTASGATSSVRRTLTAATAGSLAFLGVVLGTAGAYVGLIAGYAEDLDDLRTVPVIHLLVLVVVLPVAAALAGWLLAGREPGALSRNPLD
jgi:putative ABC transport system permease protein